MKYAYDYRRKFPAWKFFKNRFEVLFSFSWTSKDIFSMKPNTILFIRISTYGKNKLKRSHDLQAVISGYVYVCLHVCLCIKNLILFFLSHLWADFNSVCFIWLHHTIALKLIHGILHCALWPWPVTFSYKRYKMLLLRHF